MMSEKTMVPKLMIAAVGRSTYVSVSYTHLTLPTIA